MGYPVCPNRIHSSGINGPWKSLFETTKSFLGDGHRLKLFLGVWESGGRSHPFVLSSHPLHSILVPYSIPKVFALCMIQPDKWVYEQKKTFPIWQPFLAWIWEKYYRGKSESQILGWSLWSLHVTKPAEAPLFLAPPLTVVRVLGVWSILSTYPPHSNSLAIARLGL